jgi:hypothetical protein
MMKKEFIPYDLDLELIELGFDDQCIATIDQTEFIHIKGTEYPIRGAMMYDTIDVPTFSQAFRWFRDKHNLDSEIYMNHEFGEKFYTTLILKLDRAIVSHLSGLPEKHKSYEEAEVGCLRELIQILKLEAK